MRFLLIWCFNIALLGCDGQRQCNLYCDESGIGSQPSLSRGNPGPPGKRGAQVKIN